MTDRTARTAHPPRRRKPRRRFPAEVLTRDEGAALMAACDATTAVGLRNRALIAVMDRAGLRVAEALSIRPMDIDHAACSIRVLWAKGGKAKTVGIDPAALELVTAWAAACFFPARVFGRRAAGDRQHPLMRPLLNGVPNPRSGREQSPAHRALSLTGHRHDTGPHARS